MVRTLNVDGRTGGVNVPDGPKAANPTASSLTAGEADA